MITIHRWFPIDYLLCLRHSKDPELFGLASFEHLQASMDSPSLQVLMDPEGIELLDEDDLQDRLMELIREVQQRIIWGRPQEIFAALEVIEALPADAKLKTCESRLLRHVGIETMSGTRVADLEGLDAFTRTAGACVKCVTPGLDLTLGEVTHLLLSDWQHEIGLGLYLAEGVSSPGQLSREVLADLLHSNNLEVRELGMRAVSQLPPDIPPDGSFMPPVIVRRVPNEWKSGSD